MLEVNFCLNFRLYRTSWENFCKLSYNDYQNPPTEEMFLDYFKKKQQSGRTGEYMFQCYQRLRTVFLQLFGQKFESEKVKNFINIETGKERTEKSIEKSGICPHCGDVRFFCYWSCLSGYTIQMYLESFEIVFGYY